MEDPRQKRSAEQMAAIDTVEQKYSVMINDTLKSLFIKDDIEKEIKHYINTEEFIDPVNFNKFFCGGLLALYGLYIEFIKDPEHPEEFQFTVLDFLYILTQMAVNINIDLAKKEAIEAYKKENNIEE